jgi:hypothetical protein
MVNVFISVLSWHGVAVTLTFITPVGQRGKGNLTGIGGWRRAGDDGGDVEGNLAHPGNTILSFERTPDTMKGLQGGHRMPEAELGQGDDNLSP